MAEVIFDHVTRIYPGNDKPSVDDLNLDIKDGEFLVLVGPSGCGKSTTLRMLAGLEEVNKGRILIGGKDVTTMQPKDRDIAMVFQNYALYPHMTVADNNLDIKDGEFLVLVGPSGCGKSTTLRMLAGLEEVNKGRILIGGKDVTTMQPKDRDIAMVFQNYALYPHMTVADNMGFALKIAGTPKEEIRKRVEKAAEILDLTEFLDRKPKALSGGQRQRVAMGRAIVREPKVFLMDEPLSK